MAGEAFATAWRPRRVTVPPTAEVIDRFWAVAARDIVAPDNIIADGSIHRCDAAGENGKGDAAYLLHLDGVPAGGLENWRDGKVWGSWRFDLGRVLTAAEHEALCTHAAITRFWRDEAAAGRNAAALSLAVRIWQTARLGNRATPGNGGRDRDE